MKEDKVLERLEESAKTFFKKHAKAVTFKKGNILFFQGDVCEHILFLKKGVIRLYLQGDRADEITLYKISAGEQCVINTSSVVSQTPAVGTAICEEVCEGFLLHEGAVRELMLCSRVYQDYIFKLFSIRLVALAELVEDIKFKRLDKRVLEYLNEQEQRDVYITHEALAQLLGSKRVVISRVLKTLEKQGFIKQKRACITKLV